MKKISFFLIFAAVLLCTASNKRYGSDGYGVNVTHLAAEFLDASRTAPAVPVIRTAHPLLTWRLETTDFDVAQKTYRILLASSPDKLEPGLADVWDSQEVEDLYGMSAKVPVELAPGRDYYWSVSVTTNHNASSYASSCFHTDEVFDGTPSRYPLTSDLQQPLYMSDPEPGVLLADFGKDAYSKFRFTATTKKSTTISLHFGEALSDGRVLRDTGKSSIRYQCLDVTLSRGTHEYEVEFPHDQRNSTIVPGREYNPVLVPEEIGEFYPFRYCEIETPAGVSIVSMYREAWHYPFDDNASYFKCSDDTLNEVWDLCKYSIKATSALGIYIDGDRERIPYEADALINQLGHYCTDSDYSLARYSTDYLCRYATWPTEWILQAPIMAWNDYMYTGDATLLERNYDILKARTLSALKEKNGLISTRTGLQTPELMRAIGYAGKEIRDIVDWPQSGAAGVSKESAGEADEFVFSDYNAVVNAYHYNALVMLSRIAGVLGHETDASAYAAEAEAFKKVFNDSFYDRQAGAYSDGINSDGSVIGHHALHSSMFALAFGLVPEEDIDVVLKHIRSRGMACSVYGAQFLLDALYAAGDADYAFNLLSDTGIRSWFNMVRSGSTITLEAWDNAFKPNLDWNHAWGAAPAGIIPRSLMGVTPLEPGCSKVRIKPQTSRLEDARVVVPTIRGPVAVATEVQGRQYFMTVIVPPNMQAEVWVPRGNGRYRISTVGSGGYKFVGRARSNEGDRPLKVGITTGYKPGSVSVGDTYVESVRRGGNIPFIMPLAHNEEQAEAALAEMDCLILTGGEDVDPQRYGESILNESVEVNSIRDTSDFAYARVALKMGKKILAICRGEQLLNVVLGGSLYQDLPSQYENVQQHRQTLPASQASQIIAIDPNSLLHQLIGADTVAVNSFHHQAVKQIAPSLKVVAHSPDGVVEAYEGDDIIGVQFHPEAFTKAGYDTFLELFKFAW